MLNVWIVAAGEPVPVRDGDRDRLHRAGWFARFLAAQGHTVTWWTSAFDHFRKRHIFEEDTTVQVAGVVIRLLHGCGYSSNVSLDRVRDHRQVAARFAALAEREPAPDIIVVAFPPIELAWAAVQYGRAHRVPVVVDLRDMWPDVFVDLVPALAQPLARLALYPMFRQAAAVFRSATALTGITEAFLEWGLNRGKRIRTSLDRAFPFGYLSESPDSLALQEAGARWDALGVPDKSRQTDQVVTFIGTLGRQFELETVINAFRLLSEGGTPVKLVVCGSGDRLEYYRKLADGLPNVLFPGWVNAAEIHVLLRRSMVGIDPLPNRFDFLSTINNKAVEYLSAGLPIVLSPRRGVLHELVNSQACGVSYDVGDAAGLAEFLKGMAEDPGRFEVMSSNAKRVFAENFVAEKVYGDMTKYLQDIVDMGRSV